MSDERRQREPILALVGYWLIPTVLLGVGLWGGGIRPAILDLSGLSIGPAASIGILGIMAGGVFSLVPSPEPASEGRTPIEDEEATPEEMDGATGSRWLAMGMIVVTVIALLAGAIASATGAFNTYAVLFWICVPYGVGIVSLYEHLWAR
ncbi:hypothetical protein Huta_1191 [Halorhabdus utahensis DSM 12940]|uniref:Uncharacterized protein n=1 Tax=Halorhabdus utahensis (strain DSM 12940 / JCM 11049 / AX-2) TaxID=519442 RepID=C7NMQ4_HALUD|nr:hypothetical protein [Halorhabdus utahensis]ACV11367.1 hypothetical protein Huta_1191 [Halorhabdus utahensis DSM 12940]